MSGENIYRQTMRISGLQKLTLLDFPNLVACTLFLPGCQFKCPFCQNASLVTDLVNVPKISEEEVLTFLKSRKGIIDGVCVTGGEPTLQSDLKDFIRKIKDIGFKVKLDTNGYNPKILKELIDHSLLDYVAMDIKNSLEKYPLTCGVKALKIENILSSIQILKENKVPYEFRTTVIKEFHESSDFVSIAKLIRGVKTYYLQEYRDSDTCIQRGFHSYSLEEMMQFVRLLEKEGIKAELRGIE